MIHKLFSSLMIVLIITACAPATPAPAPTTTPVPATSTATIIPTPTLGIGSTLTSDKDGMTLVFVPAGEFTMGSDTGYKTRVWQDSLDGDERPEHQVVLDAFWIDQTEVTNAMYAKCVADGTCNSPPWRITKSYTRDSYYDNPEFDHYPVIYVDWNMAKTYCEWADRRLPTEAEWEKAARGTDARTYPWGNDVPNNNLLNYYRNVGDTTEVGKYQDGASPYGALDMAGNVGEWVNDWYDVYPGGDANISSDFGQTYRVVRGGAWYFDDDHVHSAYRSGDGPDLGSSYIGFRCARSPSATSAPPTSTPLPPTATNLPPTLTNTPALPTATRGIVRTLTGNDGMTLLYVPAGEFTMGSDADDALVECQKFRSDCQRDWFTDEEPPHSVHVDAFWIDQTEVTNRMYALCVEAGVCQDPTSTGWDPRSRYYGNAEFDNYPVILADWSMAKTYCEWAGRRLPTEAEWEKAARGENASVYPWGDTFDGSLVNFCDTNCPANWANKSFNDGFADVAPVGSYPSGMSVYGALDMAGNVMEWVSSLDKPYPYDATDGRENLDSSDSRVLRGGSWLDHDYSVRSADRAGGNPSGTTSYLGFRCARSPSATSAPPTSTPLPPTATNLPPTLTNTPAPPTATRGIVQTLTGNDGMTLLYVPAGEFTMGSDNEWFPLKPAHTVHLNAYWIDQTEVTNAMYAKCVADGICKEPTNNSSYTHPSYYGNPEFDNYPAIYVDWSMAKTYCEWVGRRLPTEAEWEKAARGENASVYPWGDTFDGSLVNFCDTNCPANWANKSFNDGFADVAPVGSYPSGMSVYGALDMAGNVMEWVSSLDKPYPYDATDGRENLDSSDARLVRGGSWGNRDRHVGSALGGWQDPSNTSYVIGFRCSRSP